MKNKITESMVLSMILDSDETPNDTESDQYLRANLICEELFNIPFDRLIQILRNADKVSIIHD